MPLDPRPRRLPELAAELGCAVDDVRRLVDQGPLLVSPPWRLDEPRHFSAWGGPASAAVVEVELDGRFAERVAHLGSGTALELLPGCASAHRITQAAAHTAAIVEGQPADQWVSLLHQYAWYWSGRGAGTVASRPAAATARTTRPSYARRAASSTT